MLTVLELGNYVVPAYAGMILAEQGYYVEKWIGPGLDPIQQCRQGEDLWRWINEGKRLLRHHPQALLTSEKVPFDIVLDNFCPSTLERWNLDPAVLAARWGVVWVSMRSELGERSFDLIAQARATINIAGHIPFWLGDTAGGLWMAFKALAMHQQQRPGHYVLGQASCLQKLVEGELMVKRPEPLAGNLVPWDPEPYYHDRESDTVRVDYKGESLIEPVRGRDWKWSHLWHDRRGRMQI